MKHTALKHEINQANLSLWNDLANPIRAAKLAWSVPGSYYFLLINGSCEIKLCFDHIASFSFVYIHEWKIA